MVEGIVAICFLLGFILYVLIKDYIRCRRIKKTMGLVRWCIVEDSFLGRSPCRKSPKALYNTIHNAQFQYDILPKHRLVNDSEWDCVYSILSLFQNNLIQQFLNGNVVYRSAPLFKPILGTEEEHFFICNLFGFLSKNETELCDANSELVFYKLKYITYLFCSDSPIYRRYIASWLTPSFFTNILDSKSHLEDL